MKHNRWFTYIGALIVFLTFVTKEGLYERWKDEADSVERANVVFLTTRWQTRTLDTLTLAKNDVEALRIHLIPNSYEKTLPESTGFEKLLKASEETESTLHTELDNLEKLEREVSLKQYDDRLKKLGVLIRDFDNYVALMREKGDLHVALAPFFDYEAKIFTDLPSLITAMLHDAESVQERNAKYAKYTWWISAVLFALGWSLGLVGKLYGVSGAEGE